MSQSLNGILGFNILSLIPVVVMDAFQLYMLVVPVLTLCQLDIQRRPLMDCASVRESIRRDSLKTYYISFTLITCQFHLVFLSSHNNS